MLFVVGESLGPSRGPKSDHSSFQDFQLHFLSKSKSLWQKSIENSNSLQLTTAPLPLLRRQNCWPAFKWYLFKFDQQQQQQQLPANAKSQEKPQETIAIGHNN
jgi:hypothetical protein